MDKRLRNDVRKLEAALVRFHRRPIDADPGDPWQRRVMSLVLKEAPASVAKEKRGRPGGVVWRFAMATSLAAVLLVAYAVRTDSKAQYEVAELNITAPAVFDIASAFGVLRVGGEP